MAEARGFTGILVDREENLSLWRFLLRSSWRRSSLYFPLAVDVLDAFFLFAFGTGPRGSLPAGMSQLCCLHFGQCLGRPAIRFTHPYPHRRQSQILAFGIGIGLFCTIITSIDSICATMLQS